ncbi:MAG: EscR/YscR/HrcR family type III secretion system export apparatus protein [Polyangiaceae bacterium]
MNDGGLLGQPIALVVALALVSLLPFVFMSVTAFVKISTVLQIVKSAMGTQSVPSNTVVLALSAALTFLAMAPVGEKIWHNIEPVLHDKHADSAMLINESIDAVKEPMRAFLSANANPAEKERFLKVARDARPEADRAAIGSDDLPVLVPAFVVSELSEAFAIGFLLYLPFLVLDLVVGNVLVALGMQSLPTPQVAFPFKLLLFVAIDGWGLLAQALVSGYK